jgi:hypothetical protein
MILAADSALIPCRPYLEKRDRPSGKAGQSILVWATQIPRRPSDKEFPFVNSSDAHNHYRVSAGMVETILEEKLGTSVVPPHMKALSRLGRCASPLKGAHRSFLASKRLMKQVQSFAITTGG